MSPIPVVRMAELEIAPETLESYCALLTEEIEAAVALEEGVLSLSAVSLRDNPNRIRILEVYASQKAYEAHLRTPHFLKSATEGMVRSLALIDVDPIIMRAKS
ncbi:putative quinol monooxygenase [Rhizobium lentis]|uniref:Antibiotic biosynthesis monooxygenase n=1 Tax=Rhizobium lentis TaxID=1138194 RepID=A0ABS7IFN9_9HYPH|nr:antibiotic biosynthesis monooxygenase [Rhizobium lentis]MBX5090625.1 antibiotic biosynthesis monooxygenase [Rhizobium lentis]